MKVLAAEYVVLAVAGAYDRNWLLAVYWVGAFILNVAVLMMGATK